MRVESATVIRRQEARVIVEAQSTGMMLEIIVTHEGIIINEIDEDEIVRSCWETWDDVEERLDHA
jgi:hydrogenase maturation factor